MVNNKNNQGIFHLLVILFIPSILVSAFFVRSIILTLILLVVLIRVAFYFLGKGD